ncbi:MAG TPA: hypothetical protein VGM92_15490 [Candidatus Kapabacteria bacterium]|jgi:hypothetical protein
MSLIAKDTGNGEEFKKIPEGNHIARCVRVVDLGTQSYEWQGQTHSNPKVQLSFEIPEERIEIEGKNLPMMISAEFTKSLHEKAKLRATLENWRGRKFAEPELEGFDIKKLLGVPAIITVQHATGSGKNSGKVFANITSISSAKIGGKSVTCALQENPLIYYEIEERQGGAFNDLPEWTQKKILNASEMKAPIDEASPYEESHSEPNDDIPF